MAVDRDDIQASVAAGILSEDQAAKVIALAEEREGVRKHLTGTDEPFDLFKGFNELFIIVGLILLYLGWNGITVLTTIREIRSPAGAVWPGVISLMTLFWLASYFTLKRRMVGPSNAIMVMVVLSASQFGTAVFAQFFWDRGSLSDIAFWQSFGAVFVPGFVIAVLVVFWWVFRIPSTLFAIALAIYLMVFGFVAGTGAELENLQDIFLLSASGPFAFLTIALGLVGFCIAMFFDMKDPHRVTRHSKNAFWLHIIAAPAIVNTVALTLFTDGGTTALFFLVFFLIFITVLALVVDRRSFLLSGAIYIIALAFSIDDTGTFTTMSLLGAALVGIGAQWARLRNWIMNALPDFPSKDRLPPWSKPAG